ncbi:cysteine hydrolase family protein [Desulfurococcus mucosus]|uniref:Isochorismatase hydrolase n=1 Tax=Desulfurococcus mucosus (strain ATCC 35584 / DSM 2162 / JCM 9187 / O7/1) TaxID=765177 RepID=E8R729_DESM0|nr:isochorismatase family cysteine hydrolase [Desulfurococcus mucosus]ADV64462.1 isochorismatase hydrolase [Desulfurococcus mucosus DSM 2162]
MRPALLIVDMLKEFVHGRLKSPEATQIIPAISRIASIARSKGIPVIYLADHHYPFDHELSIWGPHAMQGDPESDIIDELKPGPGDIVLYKRSYSGFRETGLDYILRDLGVDTVILTGIHTHICVLHTAIDAFYNRYKIIVVEDAVSAFNKGDHEWALNYMRTVLGSTILSSREVVSLLEGGAVVKNDRL